MPKLSVCADAQKVDRNKLLQTEFPIIEFDADTFQVLLDYLHSGCCPLSCISIPGVAAEDENIFFAFSKYFCTRPHLCSGALRLAGPDSSLFPPRQAISKDRNLLPNVGVLGKLLLEEQYKQIKFSLNLIRVFVKPIQQVETMQIFYTKFQGIVQHWSW